MMMRILKRRSFSNTLMRSIGAIRLSLPSDRSFESYSRAVDNLTGPLLSSGLQLIWRQALLDVLFDYPIQSESSDFSIRPTHARLGLRVHTVLRFLPPGGAVDVPM